MPIAGRKPQPTAVAAVLGTKDNQGNLVAERDTGDVMDGLAPEIFPSDMLSIHPRALVYFELYKQSQPRGYFSRADAPTLEKLCFMNALYDKAMNDLMEEPLIDVESLEGLGTTKTVNPNLKITMQLADGIARFVKLLGLTPLDRGRPIVDELGRPITMNGKAPSAAEQNHDTLQSKFWGPAGKQGKILDS